MSAENQERKAMKMQEEETELERMRLRSGFSTAN